MALAGFLCDLDHICTFRLFHLMVSPIEFDLNWSFCFFENMLTQIDGLPILATLAKRSKSNLDGWYIFISNISLN